MYSPARLVDLKPCSELNKVSTNDLIILSTFIDNVQKSNTFLRSVIVFIACNEI